LMAQHHRRITVLQFHLSLRLVAAAWYHEIVEVSIY
jgi:hypothetical protein